MIAIVLDGQTFDRVYEDFRQAFKETAGMPRDKPVGVSIDRSAGIQLLGAVCLGLGASGPLPFIEEQLALMDSTNDVESLKVIRLKVVAMLASRDIQ